MSFVRAFKAFIVHADPVGAVVVGGVFDAAVRSLASDIVMPS